jgi:hypothetical protein
MKYSHRNKGYALAGAVMFLLLVVIIWTGVTRQIGTNLRMENHFQAQKSYYDGSIRALSWGLKLCETGYPPMAMFQFTKPYWVPVGTDGQQKFVITYERISPFFNPFPTLAYNYRVTARPFVEGSDDSIQRAPDTFGD